MNADADDLSVSAGDGIASHLHSPQRLRSAARAAADLAPERFDPNRAAAEHRAVLDDLVASRRAR